MPEINRKWNRLSDEQRKEAVKEIIDFFESERNEKIGVVAAEELLNFFLSNIGGKLYNKGIEDSKTAINNRFEELQFDLDELLDI